MSDVTASTPATAQFRANKQRHPDARWFCRLDDPCAPFFDDAKSPAASPGR